MQFYDSPVMKIISILIMSYLSNNAVFIEFNGWSIFTKKGDIEIDIPHLQQCCPIEILTHFDQ